jgi:hypothetical protein
VAMHAKKPRPLQIDVARPSTKFFTLLGYVWQRGVFVPFTQPL